MDIRKAATVVNGFVHDFAAGYWLACIVAIIFLHHFHGSYPETKHLLDVIENFFFWNSVGAMVVILATGAGRTFTYIENWYGEDAEKMRRRALIMKHVLLLVVFGIGYLFAFGMTFD